MIGADGVRSLVRRFITGGDDTVYSGTSAFRGIVPVERLPALPDPTGNPILDGPRRPPAALRDRGKRRGGQLLRRNRAAQDVAAWGQVAGPDRARRGRAGVRGLAPRRDRDGGPVTLGPLGPVRRPSAAALVPGHGRIDRRRRTRDAAAPWPGRQYHDRGCDNSGRTDSKASAGGLAPMLRHYQSLRRARNRKIQRSSWVTNAALHLPDGPDLADRDRRVERFPQDFGWIHQFDALQAVRDSAQSQHRSTTTHGRGGQHASG